MTPLLRTFYFQVKHDMKFRHLLEENLTEIDLIKDDSLSHHLIESNMNKTDNT